MMNANEKMRAETIAMLRAVLISSPRGVPFDKLYRDYKQLTGKTIPYQELGFRRLELFIQNIPDVARAERGPAGEWTLKGIPSNEDKHVAKLISKQKKPKVRKSAKSFAKRPVRYNAPTTRFHTPVRPPLRTSGQRPIPPRFQRLTRTSVMSRHLTAAIGERQRDYASRSSSSGFSKMTINISSSNPGRSVRPATTNRPLSKPVSTQNDIGNVLNDPNVIKWIKAQIKNVPNGLWGARLCHLFKEKFKKPLELESVKQLKFRPDITRIEEPIEGRFLLYYPVVQNIAPPPVNNVSKEAPSREVVRREPRNTTREVAREEPKREVKRVEEHKPVVHQDKFLDDVLSYVLPENGSSVMVYITHIINAGEFYVNKSDAITEDLNTEIYAYYQTSRYDASTIPSVQPDQIFCAQFTEDKSFYRARILEVVDNSHVQVQYVDFGNKEVIHVDHLRVLDSKFHHQTVQSFHCCIDSVQPLDEDQSWSEASFKLFCELSFDKELKMTVKDSEGNMLSVSLYDESSNIDIGEELVKAGAVASSIRDLSSSPSSSSSSLSSSTGAPSEKITPPKKDGESRSRRLKTKSPGIVEIPADQFLDVFVCKITGTYNVYVRLVGKEYSVKSESMQECMTFYYNDSKDEVTTEPVTGDVFAMLSDEVWCRVKVLNVNGPTITVFFVDHGDTAETTKSDLRVLAPQFQQLPFQVFECALIGLPKTKNPDVIDKLEKLALDEVCVAEVVKRTGGVIFIDLIVTDPKSDAQICVNNIIRQFVIPDEELKPILPKVGDSIEVYVPYISATGSVFIHVIGAGTKRLEELTEDLTDHYLSQRSKANEFVSNPTTGKVCCAKSEDGNWYRVKILSASNRNAVEVLYVDYGNCDSVPSANLREPTQVNDHVLSLPFQALECQLYDVPKTDWSEELANRMFEIIQQGSVVTAEILSDADIPSISVLVTIVTEEGEEIKERLTNLLGVMYDEDDIKDTMGSEQDNVGHHNGETDDVELDNDKHCVYESANNNMGEKSVEGNDGNSVAESDKNSGESDKNSSEGDRNSGESDKNSDESDKNVVESDKNNVGIINLNTKPEQNVENVIDNVLVNCVQTGAHVSQAVQETTVLDTTAEVRTPVNVQENDTAQSDVHEIGTQGIQVIQENGTQGTDDVQEIGTQDAQESGSTLPGIDTQGTLPAPEMYRDVEGACVIEPVNEAVVKLLCVKDLPLDPGWLDVYVTNVGDPDHFSFQLLPNLNEFYDMDQKLNEHYQKMQGGYELIVEGGLYAVFQENYDYWYRAIVETLVKGDKAYVVFVDYGDTGIVDIENVLPLDDAFLALPFQCVQASLAGVTPKVTAKSTKLKWSKDCHNDFGQLTLQKSLVAKVTNGETCFHFSSDSPRVVVELYDTSKPGEDVSIAETLIGNNHADIKPS